MALKQFNPTSPGRRGLVLVDNVTLEEGGGSGSRAFSLFNKPKPEDVTIFTRDLALLLRAGARINDGLELLAADRDFGRLRSCIKTTISPSVCGCLSGIFTAHAQ